MDDDVAFIPVNGLVQAGEPAGGYVVLGAGKTAMDACVLAARAGRRPGPHHLGEAA